MFRLQPDEHPFPPRSTPLPPPLSPRRAHDCSTAVLAVVQRQASATDPPCSAKKRRSPPSVNVEIAIRCCAGADAETMLHRADIQDLSVGEIPILVGSALCHQPVGTARVGTAGFFIVNGQNEQALVFFCAGCRMTSEEEVGGWCVLPPYKREPAVKVIVSRTGTPFPCLQERLVNNHPLISSCVLQSRQTQFTCEVRSVPCGRARRRATRPMAASNPNRPPVVLALRIVVQTPPAMLPVPPSLVDPIIVTLARAPHGTEGPAAPIFVTLAAAWMSTNHSAYVQKKEDQEKNRYAIVVEGIDRRS